MPTWLLWLITSLMMIAGLAGTVIPGLPGIGLVYGGILVYAIATDFTQLSVLTVVILGIVTAIALGADYMGSMLGSSVGGGKKWALIGTTVGAIIGAFFSPLGLFVGAFLGALLGAIKEGSSHQQALKIAVYSMIGIVGATFVQLLLAISLIVAFVIAIIV